MSITIDFSLQFAQLLFYLSPLFIVITLTIGGMALWIGKQEGWTRSDSLYFGFITATTVGYGDFHPQQNRCKYVAIVIALIGLILTGILVAVAVEAASIVIDAKNILPTPK